MLRDKCFFTSFFAVLFVSTLWTPPADAASQDDGWNLRVSGVWVDPDVDFDETDSSGDRVVADADSELGFGVALERRFSPRLGLEFGVLNAEPDVSLQADLAGLPRLTASDSVGMTAITVGLNVHLTPGKAVDLYIGPLLGYVFFDDVGFRAQIAGEVLAQDFSTSDDFGLGAQIGADIPLGDSAWAINLAAKFLDATLEVTDEDGEETDLGFDPLILSFGFGYRF